VPDVTGEAQADAVARLSDDGFRIRQRSQPVDSEEGDGVVISQDPAGGNAPRGSTVTITVGEFTAPEPTPEPTTPSDGSGDGTAEPTP
jgi:serine/threonine-protein kinase